MKICVIGCVQFSRYALRRIFDLENKGVCSVVGVITKKKSSFNADFADLKEEVLRANKPRDLVHYYKNQDNSVEFISTIKADIVYCFGWNHILKKDLLTIAPMGVVGFHPADLPQNRGRHPIIWALVNGLTQTASTFFKMDEGVDSGPIISQEKINISYIDDAKSLYDKITNVAMNQIKEFTPELANGTAKFIPQDHSRANYWRKRCPRDGRIDWRMDAEQIYNLVRGLSPPYPGAEFEHVEKGVFKVWKAQVSEKLSPRNLEPGKILAKKKDNLLVKCGGSSSVWLTHIEPLVDLSVGEYL